MSGNYEKGMYNQLMEVMAQLDAVESSLSIEKAGHKDDVKRLNTRINELTQENQLLRDDNARLKSIINNDSSNTSLSPKAVSQSIVWISMLHRSLQKSAYMQMKGESSISRQNTIMTLPAALM